MNESITSDIWKTVRPLKSNVLNDFRQRFSVFNATLIDVFSNASLWEETIPHEESGPCFTYNPPVPSDPGWYYGLEMRPNTNGMESNWPIDLEIFLHEKDKFFYFMEAAPPNNIKIHTNTLRNMNHALILGNLFVKILQISFGNIYI